MYRFRFAFAHSFAHRFAPVRALRRLALGLLLGSIALPLVPALLAQTTSTIEGTVTDHQGLAISGAELSVTANTLAVTKKTTTDANGNYQIAALPAGIYTITVSHAGFGTEEFKDLEITLNRTLKFNMSLGVGTVEQKVVVSAEIPLLETTASSEGATIVPSQIVDMPINGRNYLDLMQLVPGVGINRQADLNSDNATPVLGERANNTGFLIDGLSNQNELSGGAASQFNQDTIAEFQVITTGYKAEFGHASGGVVNVITSPAPTILTASSPPTIATAPSTVPTFREPSPAPTFPGKTNRPTSCAGTMISPVAVPSFVTKRSGSAPRKASMKIAS